jgi:hypothetical protein
MTPAKLSLRARYKELEKFCNTLKVNSENATFVANAMFWKHGYTNRPQIIAAVDEYMAHMASKVEEAKREGTATVMEGFIDQTILDKVAEFADTESSTESE